MGECFAADLSPEERDVGIGSAPSASSTRDKKTSKKAKDNILPRLMNIDPKRPGSWYTENEIGAASGMLQGVKQNDLFLRERPTSVVKKEQLEILTNHFGKRRGEKIYSAIIAQETSMTKTDVKAMRKFENRIHVEDQETFRKYISRIREEIPTVDRKTMKENIKCYERGSVNEPVDEDDLSFTMIEESPFLVILRNGIPVGAMVLAARLPNGSPLLVRQRAFILRVGRRP